jgi:hypothetical protein
MESFWYHKTMAEASFFLVLILWFIFNFSFLQLQSSIYTKVASWKTFSVLYVRTVNSIICAVAEDFVYISTTSGVYDWSINPAYLMKFQSWYMMKSKENYSAIPSAEEKSSFLQQE